MTLYLLPDGLTTTTKKSSKWNRGQNGKLNPWWWGTQGSIKDNYIFWGEHLGKTHEGGYSYRQAFKGSFFFLLFKSKVLPTLRLTTHVSQKLLLGFPLQNNQFQYPIQPITFS